MRLHRLAAAIAAAICMLPAAASGAFAACGSDVFFKAGRIPVDFRPGSVAPGFFNDDAIPDLAVGSTGFPSGGLVAFLGNGDGTFGPPIPVADETVDFQFLIAADFNGDGSTDLAVDVGNHFTGVYLSNGDGTFQDQVLYPGTQFPEGMAAANLTGEGVDVILAGDNGEAVVLPGNGDGTFGDPIHSGTAGSWLAVGDVTGDGEFDIVSVFDRYVAVSPGNGDRTFNAAQYYAVAPLMTSIAIADMDGDGHDDVLVAIDDFAEVTGGYVAVLLNNGDGTLQAGVETAVGPETRSLQVADLDGDGRRDAVVAANGFVNVLLGTGPASFDSPVAYLAAGARALTLADFDGDGLLDVAAANPFDASVSILLSLGGGELDASRALLIPFVNGPHDFAIADLDGDALGDLLATGDGLQLRRGLGNGAFDADFVRLGDIDFVGPVAVADFDGDGLLDAAEAHASGGLVGILLNTESGEFLEAGQYFVPFTGTGALLAADFDGSGSIDLASASGGPAFAVLLGNGDGTFGTTVSTPLTNAFPIAWVAGLLDGDELPDVAFVASGGGLGPDSLRVLLSNGDGTFSEHAEYPLDFSPYSLAVADIAGSASLDIIVADGGGGLLLYVGNGDGTFQDPTEIPLDYFPTAVWVGDFDADGIPDLLVPDSGQEFSPAVGYLRGLGGGAFEAPVSYPVSGQPVRGQAAAFSGAASGMALLGTNSALSFLVPQRLTALALVASPVVGTAAHLHASASGAGPFSWQWRRNGVDLTDGGTVSGAQSPVLTIDPVSFDDAGSYDVVVTGACGTVTSNAATLSVEFADVPVSSPFHDDIITIATEGITGGCGGGNYCPTLPVRRDQMAALLLKAEHGSDYTPPPCTGVFSDVPCPSLFADWIEQLAAEGVTAGCGTGVYCPSQLVTRAQMAVFLLKTSEGSGYAPPPATGIFGDVPVGSFAANFIEDLYNRGITGGCSASPLLYCPSNPVLRQQMATLLVRTFLP